MRRKHRSTVIMAVLLIHAMALPAIGKMFKVGESSINALGYISQSAQFSTRADGNEAHDVEEGLNQALTTALLETEIKMPENLSIYLAGKMTVDWIYDIKNGDDSWSRKQFSSSRDDLYLDDEWWQVLHETHVTWAPGSFLFRVGKQIVSWGEMDFTRVMDQINPTDQRRGFSDVEFESTVIPIPMFRGEWWPDMSQHGTIFEELGFQFILIPNAEFIPDLRSTPANGASGIWSANVIDPATGARIGGLNSMIDEPDEYDPSEFEFGMRLQALTNVSVITINGFYGRANAPVQKLNMDPGVPADPLLGPPFGPGSLDSIKESMGLIPPGFGNRDSNGRDFIFLNTTGFYPRQRFIGCTLATEIPALGFSAIGGTAPVVRTEVKYEFDRLFEEGGMNPLVNLATGALIHDGYIESDVLEMGLGVDWKFKINAINDKAYLDTSSQFFYTRIADYPDPPYSISGIPHQDTFAFSTYIRTAYFNAKLEPSLAYMYDISNEGHLLLLGLSYSPTTNWKYSLDYAFHEGNETGQSMDVFENKDYISVKVRYTFG